MGEVVAPLDCCFMVLATNASSAALLRSFSATTTCIGWLIGSAPVIASPRVSTTGWATVASELRDAALASSVATPSNAAATARARDDFAEIAPVRRKDVEMVFMLSPGRLRVRK
jgi:hypothetical protein